jgi:diguanylate cyclase (GGDEF)-like protein/PAS domain S-box-containing protein
LTALLDFDNDVAAVQAMDVVPYILDIVCNATGMGFAVVARVSDRRWKACQVRDAIGLGVVAGQELDIDKTLCRDVQQTAGPIVIDSVSESTLYRGHAVPALYGFESYISVPIVLADGTRFGTLCALDRVRAKVSEPRFLEMFKLFADLIGFHLLTSRRLSDHDAVRRSHSFTQSLLAASPDCIKVLSDEGVVEFINERGVEVNELGTADALLGKELALTWPAAEQAKMRSAIDRAVAGEIVRFEGFCPTHEGNPRWWEVSLSSFQSDAGPVKVVIVARDITARVRDSAAAAEAAAESSRALALVNAEIRFNEARYRSLFETIDVGFCIIEMIFDDDQRAIDYRFLEISTAFVQQTGMVDARGRRMRELAPDHEQHWFDTYARVALTRESVRFASLAKEVDNRWFEVYAYAIDDPALHRVAVVFSDVTERHAAEVALRESNEALAQFKLLAEHSGVVVMLSSMDGIRHFVSSGSKSVLGWKPEELVGFDGMDFVHPDDQQIGWDARAALFDGRIARSDCFRHRHADGSWVWVEAHARIIDALDTGGLAQYVTVIRDATDRKAAEVELARVHLRLEHMAAIDGLTGIANRRQFDAVALREWRRCEREKLPLSLLLLDADHFKTFNDRYGHVAGDACLRAIAQQADSIAQRPGDLAARYGGEEFLVLLSNTPDDGAAQIGERVRALIQELDTPHEGNEGHRVVTVSIGVVTVWPGRAGETLLDVEALFAAVDAALYAAKAAGRNRVVVYSGEQVPPLTDFGSTDIDLESLPTPMEPAVSSRMTGEHEAMTRFLYNATAGMARASLDGTIELINPSCSRLLAPLAQGGRLDNLFTMLDGAASLLRTSVQSFRPASGAICEALRVEVPPADRQGGYTKVLSISLWKLDASTLMALVSDVTSEARHEQPGAPPRLDLPGKIEGLARADIHRRIEQAIARNRHDPAYGFAVLFVNCDRFKQINDALGLAVGDRVLELMAERLRSVYRDRDNSSGQAGHPPVVGRVGGDEFVLLVDDRRSLNAARKLAREVLEATGQVYEVGSHRLHLSVSIGILLRAQTMNDADAVLQDSSIAMVAAKRAGGARFAVFEPLMHERELRNADLERDLRDALDEGQLFAVYQPVVPLAGGAIVHGMPLHPVGVEALVRWRHPDLGVVSPAEFIAVAEKSGLIAPLGAFVLNAACRQFVEWQLTLGSLAPTLLAVNLSRQQLREPGFVDRVRVILQDHDMRATQLQFEVTESLAAQDTLIQTRLHALKVLGIRLALDDFGTGYSSLASLHMFPVDTVKIDRAFVAEIASSQYHRVLTAATIQVAHALRMDTIAEGIESAEQASILGELGCTKGQGYYFSEPLDAVAMGDWLLQRAAPPMRDVQQALAPLASPGA